jgi:hypothetical protein
MALIHLGVVVSAAATSSASSASSSIDSVSAASEARGCQDRVRIYMRMADNTGSQADLLAEARREADRIWAANGVDLIWQTRTGADAPLREDTVYVVMRHALSQRMAGTGPALRRDEGSTLAWIQFTEGVPGRMIEVSVDAVNAVASLTGDYRERALPPLGNRIVLGRALGRAIAHEIGHWLLGSGHAGHGLMKALLTPMDLVQPFPPVLVVPPTARPFITRMGNEDAAACFL